MKEEIYNKIFSGQGTVTFTMEFPKEDDIKFKAKRYNPIKEEVIGEIWVNGKYVNDAIFYLNSEKMEIL